MQSFLLKLFLRDELTEPQEAFNRPHKKTRVAIERAFSEMKARWRCLNKQGTVVSNISGGMLQQSILTW